MIDIVKSNGCDSCGNEIAILHTLSIGKRKEVTLCEECMQELVEKTNAYLRKLEYSRNK